MVKSAFRDFLKKPVLTLLGGETELAMHAVPLVGLALASRQPIPAHGKNLAFVQNILHCAYKLDVLRAVCSSPGFRQLRPVGDSMELDIKVRRSQHIDIDVPPIAHKALRVLLHRREQAVIVVLGKDVEVLLLPEVVEALS